MATQQSSGKYVLEIPVDAKGVTGFSLDKQVKALAIAQDGGKQSGAVKFAADGTGTATFTFAKNPGSVKVYLGPDSASDDDLPHLQTLTVDVAGTQFAASATVRAQPVVVTDHYWIWWWRWCLSYTVTGRIVCPGTGAPVPFAQVKIYDVAYWWWWSSKVQVATAITDVNGAFKATFTRCCGWWPWWWWETRFWRIEEEILQHLLPIIKADPNIGRIVKPTATPDLNVLHTVANSIPAIRPLLNAPRPALSASAIAPRAASSTAARVSPATLAQIADPLKQRLPRVPELDALRLWPWWPWQPWNDCNANILFEATQNCLGTNQVILDESIWQTHWDIPQSYNVTLTANDKACCAEKGRPDPTGDCMVYTDLCGVLLDDVGGNPAAPASPVGFAYPGGADRPFGDTVNLSGLFGDASGADYYTVEYREQTGAGPTWSAWQPLPQPALEPFSREYADYSSFPPVYQSVPFTPTLMNGHWVYESRPHYEANHAPGTWNLPKLWLSNRDLLLPWDTSTGFTDGTYELRVRSWTDSGGTLTNEKVLPWCGTDGKTPGPDNGVLVTLDNRLVPSTPDVVSGITSVAVNGATVSPCGFAHIDPSNPNQTLVIDFYAYDFDGHLDDYSLIVTYGYSQSINLLDASAVPSGTVSLGPASGGAPAALQVGPTYAQAVSQGAARPVWAGGAYQLTVTNANQVFPETCAYQLELRTYKRTIDSCSGLLLEGSGTDYSFTVIVGP